MGDSNRLRRELALWRAVALVALVGLAVLAVLSVRARLSRAIVTEAGVDVEAEVDPPERLTLQRVDFEDLPGWRLGNQAAALPALRRSCEALSRRQPDSPISSTGLGGSTGDWRPVCERTESLGEEDEEQARALLEAELTPYLVTDAGRETGLFTGYYEPTLRGSRRPGNGFDHPLYLRPPELVEVDLGQFRPDLEGRRIAGRLDGGRLRPFADRSAIDSGGLAGRDLELLWVDDPLDAFFLHIQGSGRVELAEGGFVRVGYAAQNGHPYLPIGRELVERGEMELEEVSMQSIRAWLEANPEEAADVLARNASYVFFRELSGGGPVGSLGVELVAERSLAVDRRHIPLGVPMWVDTTLPPDADGRLTSWRRLMLAQDTGGAIRGPVRGDLYWGPGSRAAELAGRMRQEGRLWLLLPSSLDEATASWIARAAAAHPSGG